jgi:hypothetical protein
MVVMALAVAALITPRATVPALLKATISIRVGVALAAPKVEPVAPVAKDKAAVTETEV